MKSHFDAAVTACFWHSIRFLRTHSGNQNKVCMIWCLLHILNLFMLLFGRKVESSFVIPLPIRIFSHKTVEIMIYDVANFIRWWIWVRPNTCRRTQCRYVPLSQKKKQRCEILLRATIYYYRASVEATNWWRQVRCFRRIFSAVLIYAVDLKVSYIFFSFSTLIFHFATNDGGHTFTLIAVSHLLDSRYTEWKVTAKNFHIAIRPLAGQRWNCV